MKYYQDNESRKIGIDYSNPLTSKGEFVVFVASITDGNGNKVKEVSLPKNEGCLVGTGLRIVTGGGYSLIFTHSSHVALHLDRYFFDGKTQELMLQVANPSAGRLTISIGDEIASFVLVENKTYGLVRVNSTADLLER